MGTVEKGHIFLIDKNLSLTHAKKLLCPASVTVILFAIMTEYIHDVDM